MNPLLLKFIKHAGFVLAGAAVAALVGLLQGDPAVTAFISTHPILAGFVPGVAGALGALSQLLKDLDTNS